nr:immunoglobulin light chain junction region [Macaca mulatta]MOX79329.1 immunoglobulin light chain junction region [Macaca mulatta]MOX79608.1 immunoglobulin light chain junction region [Macaca mulatta]MOX80515.1 immunoglobulin light chain junction region [Macaca mulatta]
DYYCQSYDSILSVGLF